MPSRPGVSNRHFAQRVIHLKQARTYRAQQRPGLSELNPTKRLTGPEIPLDDGPWAHASRLAAPPCTTPVQRGGCGGSAAAARLGRLVHGAVGHLLTGSSGASRP